MPETPNVSSKPHLAGGGDDVSGPFHDPETYVPKPHPVPVFLDPADNLHPYECHGIGVCVHCDRLQTKEHNPATCELCDPEYDYAPNPFREESSPASSPSTLDSSIDIEGAQVGWTGAPDSAKRPA